VDTKKLFEKYGTKLQKVAFVFSRKTGYRLDREEVHQEFAVRLLELNQRYPDKDDKDFEKVLNWSLHNLGCDLLKKLYNSPVITLNEELNLVKEVFEPSFIYFFKEAGLSVIQNARSREIFSWLVDNFETVEDTRAVKNAVRKRTARVSKQDIIEVVARAFKIPVCAADFHIRMIKEGLAAVRV